MLRKWIVSFLLIGISTLSFATTTESIPPRPTKAINAFIHQTAKKYNFNKKQLTLILSKAKYDPKVIQWITYPFEKKPWDFYRQFFIKPERIENGVKYWKENKKLLTEIASHYHVDPSVIVAIIGIESDYGTKVGKYGVLDALVTLSFYYPKRQAFFKSELTQFLLLTRHEKLNPETLKGSYAGALGIPQFMPSTYRYYGVDYSKNSSIDLFTNHADAIASIANYLSKSGWKNGAPIAVKAKTPKKVPARLISKTGIPRYTLSQFKHHRITPIAMKPKQLKAALIKMQNTDSVEYWLVFRNFRAIMKYNPRTTYALAVFELSRAIKKDYEKNI